MNTLHPSMNYMNDNNIQMFIFLIVVFVSMNVTSGIVNISTIKVHNRSLPIKQYFIPTPNLHSWKKSNSIEILKKLIANRQNLKNNRILLLTSKFYFIIL
jgi:hypothetical protein